MTRQNNPKVSQRAIAAALRRYRAVAGVTIKQAAGAADYDSGSLSRAEQGKGTPHPAVVRALLKFYGETDPEVLDSYAALAKHGRKRGWWNQYSDLMTVAYIGLEGAATSISCLENQLVPGLLQTSAYTKALIMAECEAVTQEELDRRLTVRDERKLVLSVASPCEFRSVIDEAVLHRVVGSPAIMAEQLDHLVEMSRLQNVEIQVMPFGAGAHGSLGSRFVILRFEDPLDPGTVYLEQMHWKDEFIEDDEDIEAFSDAFGRVQAAAETPARSLTMIKRARDNFRNLV